MFVAEYAQPLPNEPAVSWASTVTPARGAMCSCTITAARPISIGPSRAPSISSVRWARLARGSRKEGTPLAIASTPVSAEQPAAKALRINSTPRASLMGIGCAVPTIAAGCERMSPMMMMPTIAQTNSTIGSIRNLALSAMPHRFTAVSRARPPRHTASRCGARTGNAEARLAAPAARLTATVST